MERLAAAKERASSSAQAWSWPRFGVGGSSSGPLYCLACLPFPRNPAATHTVLLCGLPFPSQVILPSSPLFPLVKILYPWQFPSPTNKTRPHTVLTASNLGYYEERKKWTHNNVGRIDTSIEIKRLFAICITSFNSKWLGISNQSSSGREFCLEGWNYSRRCRVFTSAVWHLPMAYS